LPAFSASGAEGEQRLTARAEGWQDAVALRNLSEAGNVREAAANLFAYMQALDRSGAPTIAVEPIPADGLGEAINDRRPA
ncbi:Sua5 family C-terminal domain-containing protein, partial [Mesorhizobium sp.]|uniref:Sua5 family C-terminal domain-containing protein n=1 Tax=Mesorhizobium sp. TaxID=1871066 RepID=UPI000FE49A09